MTLLERARQLKLQALQQGRLLPEEVAISVALTEYQEFNDARFAVIAGIVAALAPFDPLVEGLELLADFDPEAAKARRALAEQQQKKDDPQ